VLPSCYQWDRGLKISVSLPSEDVEFLDEYAKSPGVGSRSAVVQRGGLQAFEHILLL